MSNAPVSTDPRNEWEKPSALGYSYAQVRGMDDVEIIKAGLDSKDRLAHELANRLDLANRTADTMLARWWYEARYRWATVSGWMRRRLGLGFRNGRTVMEVVYELEKDPVLRQLLKEARAKVKSDEK